MTETIRLGQLRDTAALTRFNVAMAWETEQKRLDEVTVAGGVRNLIDNAAAGFYLVAEHDGQAVAGLLVTYEWSDWRNGVFWWIQSVYVLPEYRRRGVFTRLYRHVESMARTRGDVCGLRLYVEQNNAAAQSTYKNLGMDETHYDVYEIEFPRNPRDAEDRLTS